MRPRNYFLNMILLVALLTAFGQVRAQQQYMVTRATGKKLLPGTTGIYYALPKTVFKVHLVMEEVRQIPGPFAEYAQKYLGTDNYIKTGATYYKLLSVKVEPVTVADPSHAYFIEFPRERSSKNPRVSSFQLSSDGELIGYGFKIEDKKDEKSGQTSSQILVYSNDMNGGRFSMGAMYSRAQQIDTLVRKVTIDTVTIKRFKFRTSWINLTPEEQANDAAQLIHKIRTNRFNLLTGYQEVNYGEGIKYMDDQLKKLEDEYLALFLGKETRTTVVRNFEFDPEKGHLTKTLMQYIAKSGNTEAVTLNVSPMNDMENISSATTAAPDELFYRIPVKASVSVVVEGNAFYSDIFTIPQLGVVTTAAMGNSHIQLDPSTGALVRIISE
ncbi:MAG: DUF4831 family protein [Bacteroidales bacterium]|nr:DUF4831 family protein [Bacteroidales bacterium]